MNRCIFTGNLGRDAEMKFTKDGDAVTNFSMAIYRGKDVDPIWMRVSCWRELAERVNKDCQKGDKVLVEGYLSADDDGGPRMWDDDDGNARASFEMTATWVEYLSRRDDDDDEKPARREKKSSKSNGGGRRKKGASRKSGGDKQEDEEELF